MVASAPRAWVLSLVGALLLTCASPVSAAESAAPAGELVAATVAPLLPGLTALAPVALSDVVQQIRPTDLGIPRPSAGAFEAPALRRSLYVSFGALQVLDGLSTRKALSSGAVEANPAMAGVAKNSTALFAVKAGSAVATAFFAEKLAKKHPRRATVLMTVLNTAYVAVVAHNYRVARAQ